MQTIRLAEHGIRAQGEASSRSEHSPRIYYLHPLQAGPLVGWPAHLDRCRALGFSHVMVAPVFQAGPAGSLFLTADFDRLDDRLDFPGDAAGGLRRIAAMCRDRGLTLLLDVVTDRIAVGSPAASLAGDLFRTDDAIHPLDPRFYSPEGAAATADPASADALASWWSGHLASWAQAGVGGFRLVSLAAQPASFFSTLVAAVRAKAPDCLLFGWTPGVPQGALPHFAACAFNYVFSSLPWWDFHDEWFFRELAVLRRLGRVIGAPEAPFGPRLAAASHGQSSPAPMIERAIGFAAATGDGWMLPMGCEYAASHRLDPVRDTQASFARDVAEAPADLTAAITAANTIAAGTGEHRLLSAPGSPVIALLRGDAPDARFAARATVTLANTDLLHRRSIATDGLFAGAGASFVPFTPGLPVDLAPGEVLTVAVEAAPPILPDTTPLAQTALQAARTPRIAIEAVTPSVDEGRFPARRVVGDLVAVEADIICEGHDVLGVVLAFRTVDSSDWTETRMRPLGNDRFAASFPLLRLGLHEFTIEAWRDEFATFRSEVSKKHAAGNDIALELEEGRALVARTLDSAHATQPELRMLIDKLASASAADRLALLLSNDVADLMTRADPRPFAVRITPSFPLEAERTTARFASWYEIFPRSMSNDASRHGNFHDVITQLPRIRDMGFDVLYFPPIHPIGRTNRKGRNNTLTPSATDPGSPYAIGSAEGGHDAIHPELGTLADFQALRHAAADHGLELALDFAIQCAPDHPWLKQHKGWFDWRPDGSIKYAENPPKKYQDIVNVDFFAHDAVPSLWVELCGIVLFWAEQGIRIFRVDNPHTKPLPFWQWMIREVKNRYPDTMFLAEAFTKPKMMYRLAKVGFSQSYTYFTWRDSRAELTSYLEELTTTAPKDFFRPNFFVNTPDINPVFVQTSGRPGFLIKAALATTLSGLWGLYSGFELCEATPLPGREEYADAEKYEIKAWDWDRPGNIVAEVSALNWMRRTNPALQTHLGVKFLPGGNPSILTYEKATPDRSNVVLVAVNLDPFRVQETDIEVPLWSWALPDDGALAAEDLVAGTRDVWHGKYRHLRLDPQVNPYAIWRVSPAS